MATMNCKACNKEIDAAAMVCPHCKTVLQPRLLYLGTMLAIVSIGALVALAGVVRNGLTPPAPPQELPAPLVATPRSFAAVVTPVQAAPPQAQPVVRPPDGEYTGEWLKLLILAADLNQEVTYAHLKKNAETHKGKEWAFSGRVLEISEERDGGKTFTAARISIDAYGEKPLMVVAPFGTDFVEGASVDVVGVLAGSHSYTSQAGWNITIPSIVARSITKRGAIGKIRAEMKAEAKRLRKH